MRTISLQPLSPMPRNPRIYLNSFFHTQKEGRTYMRSISSEKLIFFCHPVSSKAGDKPLRVFLHISATTFKPTALLMHKCKSWCSLHSLSFTLKHDLYVLQDKSASPFFFHSHSAFLISLPISHKDFLPWHYRHALMQDPYKASAQNKSS